MMGKPVIYIDGQEGTRHRAEWRIPKVKSSESSHF